jgi:hypothetical protein
MTTTIVQAERLLNLGKIIIGALVTIIITTGTVSIYGANFASDTKHNFATVFTGLKEVKDIATGTNAKVDTYHIDDVKFQQSTEDRLRNLETKPEQHYPQVHYTYKTQHMDANRNPTMQK